MRTKRGRSVNCLTKASSYKRSRTSTWARPRAKAGSVPGRIRITSSALELLDWYSGAMVTTLAPCSLASVSQWPSGILVAIQFLPHRVMRRAFSAVYKSKSRVCWPVTMGWPGGRSVCHA
jgi:hypothetical protein